MTISHTARHCIVPDTVRQRADKRLASLKRYEPRLARADVIFELDHGVQRVEARLFVAGSHTIVAHGDGATFREALDLVVARLSRQLKRRRERRVDHQAVKLSEIAVTAEGGE